MCYFFCTPFCKSITPVFLTACCCFHLCFIDGKFHFVDRNVKCIACMALQSGMFTGSLYCYFYLFLLVFFDDKIYPAQLIVENKCNTVFVKL